MILYGSSSLMIHKWNLIVKGLGHINSSSYSDSKQQLTLEKHKTSIFGDLLALFKLKQPNFLFSSYKSRSVEGCCTNMCSKIDCIHPQLHLFGTTVRIN